MLSSIRPPTSITLTLCANLVATGLFTFGLRAVLAAGRGEHRELTGTWVMQLPDQGKGTDGEAALLPHGTLTLNDDGTFTQHMENYVMVTIVMDSKGTYARSGDTLTLTGISTTFSDDGYGKGTHREPLKWRLKYADNALTMLDDRAGGLLFRRKGDKAAVKPRSGLRASDPTAVQIVRQVQRRYAALHTYSDEGTLTSPGFGPMAKHASFQTRFVRPLRFVFRFAQVINGKPAGELTVLCDDQNTWLYTGGDRSLHERGVDEALSAISPICGNSAMLVPMLLLPDEIRRPKLDVLFQEITLAGEEKAFGKDCQVVSLRNPGGAVLKLWVEKSDALILRAFDGLSKATITYQPKCNIKINDSELRFTPPK